MAETRATLSNNIWVAVASGSKAGLLQNRSPASAIDITIITTATGGPTAGVAGIALQPGQLIEVMIPSGESLYARGRDLGAQYTHRAVLIHRTVT